MKLYGELAEWFHLVTAPEDYAEEAGLYADLIVKRATRPVESVLELGSGGGNNASHMKRRFRLALTDVSPEMLATSRRLNPECEHVEGDMRTLRLERVFDAVFVHDAVMYMTSEKDLKAVMLTAARHLRAGGVALFAPDCVDETFREHEHDSTHRDADGRSLRYHARIHDPDPSDRTYRVEMTIQRHSADGKEAVDRETHTFGLFRRTEWIDWLTQAGFRTEAIPVDLGDEGAPPSFVFVGVAGDSVAGDRHQSRVSGTP